MLARSVNSRRLNLVDALGLESWDSGHAYTAAMRLARALSPTDIRVLSKEEARRLMRDPAIAREARRWARMTGRFEGMLVLLPPDAHHSTLGGSEKVFGDP